jgi:hypothetical protein
LKRFVLAITAGVLASSAFGAPALEDAQRCLTDNTNGKERKELVRWVFLAIAAHPEIRALAAVPPEAPAKADRLFADLVTRLIVDACPKEVSLLIKEEGAQGLKLAFQTLGQVAMAEMITDPSVTARMAAFTKLLDEQKFRPLMAPSK